MNHISATYNYWLVDISFAVAILTSYTAIDLAARVTANRGAVRSAWLAGGAIAMGSGIWCMHYIGMLAFHLPIPVAYHIPTVVLSLLTAILASFGALYFVSLDQMSKGDAALGSVVLGLGVAAAHYVGMEAMRLDAVHRYNPLLWLASLLIAVVIGFGGLNLMHYLREDNRGTRLKLAISAILGVAFAGMLYTGLAAISFTASKGVTDYADSVGISMLASGAIFAVTAVILGLALITSLVDRRITGQHLTLESERTMLRALIDNIPDSMYVKDSTGRFILANRQLARVMGVNDPQLLLGKSDYDFYPPELATDYHQDEVRMMHTGLPLFEHEEEGFDVEGNRIPILTTKVPLRDVRGQLLGIAGVGRDISERKKSEEALRQAERKYRGMFDEALVGLFKLDAEGGLLQVNPAMAAYLGYADPDDMLAKVTGPLWLAAASPKRRSELIEVLESDGHVRSFELEVSRYDGGKIWISSSIRAQYSEERLIGFVGLFEDITERKLLRERLLQAQKLESVGQLAAGIAHEINTPVQYIGDNVRFLKDSFSDLILLSSEYARLFEAVRGESFSKQDLDAVSRTSTAVDFEYLADEIPKAIEQTLEGVARVAGLVGAMKEFSHPGTGQKVRHDLNHAIKSTITVARNEWKYVADVNVDLDPELPLVACIPGEFNQVILNIIVNAAHAIADAAERGGPCRGLITVTTRSLPGWVEVRLADTGLGIPEHVRSRIFDPFFTTKEIGKGTGQGLAIARSVVVDKHQGTIDFESEEGVGTTFIIRLPVRLEETKSQELAAA